MRWIVGLAIAGLVACPASAQPAAWIAPWTIDPALPTDPAKPRPCPILRREFTLDAAPKSAVVRVIGLGHFQLHCNGKVVGDSVIDQAWSQYNKRLYWQEFDIKPLLREGENVLGVMLGNSFWRVEPANDGGRFIKTDATPDFSQGRPFLLWLEARIRIDDSSEIVIASDEQWRWHDGPLTFSNIYAGEDYDSRLLPSGWAHPWNGNALADDGAWRPVNVVAPPPAQVERLPSPPIRAFEVFDPLEIREPAPSVFTYVFPQNCSSLLRFTVSGTSGAKVRFKPCEFMDETGRVKFTYTWGTGKDIWHDFTLGGGASEFGGGIAHQTLFCYVGCQYVEVTGAVPTGRPNPDNLPVIHQLQLVHTRAANRESGTFECSDELQNGIHRLIDWSIRSNMSHVATDCPHREKNGWLEQTWHMANAVSYRLDVRDWYRKIAIDIADTQLPDGHIPTNCPNYLVGVPPHGYWNEAPEWGVAGVLVPWHLYEWYGDREALARSFDSMRRYVDYVATQAKDGVITSNLGDWYDFGHGKGDGPSQWTPNEVSATAIWALAARTVAEAADVLDRADDAKRYRAMFETIRATFQQRFWNAETGMVKSNGSCQAANAAALCIGLIPEEGRALALQRIVEDLELRQYQQTTGEVLHVFLVRALAENGRGDLLHKIYARTDRGSYGYMVNSGLTTLPESWDAKPGTGNSMNHYMLGHAMEWHFAYVAGIRQQPGSIGWKKVLIAPQPGTLAGAQADFNSPNGRISSKWRRANGEFTLEAHVPAGVDAVAVLPDSTRHPLKSGDNTLRCRDQ